MQDDFTIEAEDFTIEAEELENAELDAENGNINGFFSVFKKIARKATRIVNTVSKLPVVGDMIPPSAKLGLSFLNNLTRAERKTGRKIKFSVGATKAVYSNAFLKGRLYEHKRMIRRMRRL